MLFECRGEKLKLLPQKAIWWEKQEMLILADLHLGKANHFQSAGIAISNEVEDSDLKTLASLFQQFKPKTCLVVGDFFHSTQNKSIDKFAQFFRAYQFDFLVVPGNHDRFVTQHVKLNEIIQFTKAQYHVGPFCFSHDPTQTQSDLYVIGGHVHPAVKLKGFGKQSMKLPCFYFGNRFAILPAFSKFTGTYVILPQKEDQIVLVAQDQLIRV
jgi:DNA ligase-associated metallophosphoesterase